MGRKELKEKAKASLNGKYGESIKLLLIYYCLIFGINVIVNLLVKANLFDKGMANILNNLLSFIIGPLLSMGMVSFFLKIARNEKVTYNELFSKTNYFWKNLGFTTLVFIVSFLVGIIITILLIMLYPGFDFYHMFTIKKIIILYSMVLIPLFMIGIIISYIYAEWHYIALDYPDISLIECLQRSRIMMHGHKWELFKLNLSFVGWYILSVFTLGILLLWVVPYNSVTLANFYEHIKDQK